MTQTIPFTKNIVFDTKLNSIVSISLEHELNSTTDEFSGNFIISGEYKTHELSINKEKFLYKVPFSVELTDNIDKDSIKFNINDFTYDVIGDDTLKVMIEFTVSGKELPKEEVVIERPKEIIIPEVENYTEIEDIIMPGDRDEKSIIEEKVSNSGEEFITYHVHIVRNEDTFESISIKYKVDIESIKLFNNVDEISLGDKLIIPDNLYE